MPEHALAAAADTRARATAKRLFVSFLSSHEARHADQQAERAFMRSGERAEARYEREHLEVRCWGQGPSVLLVHGLHLSGGKFQWLAPALADAGFRAVAVDLPGHGDTPCQFVDPDDVAAALLQVEASMGPSAGIVAHSMGAVWALHAMRAGLTAPRLTCVGAPPSLDYTVDYYVSSMEMPASVEHEFRRLVQCFSVGVSPPMEHVPAPGSEYLVVHDEDDPLAPFSDALALVDAWQGCRTLWTRRLGHFKTLKDPRVIRAIVDFQVAGYRWHSPATAPTDTALAGDRS